jgi:SPP1 gp7 family putative phage head morphogenesis protein
MKFHFQRMTRLEAVYRREIEKLFERYAALPTFETLGQINATMVEYARAKNFIQAFAEELALNMITQVAVTNARSWRAAATKSSKGREIYAMLRQEMRGNVGMRVRHLVRENADYISTVPVKIARQVTQHVQEQQMKGLRSSTIAKDLRQYIGNLRDFEINRIARTEVAKADTAITRARAEQLNLNWYQWQTSEDARVRKSHRKMDLVVINWSDAPSPETLVGEKSEGHYHAGNIYNCRCIALPITDINELSYPVRIYAAGGIKRLTRSQFRLLSSGRRELAA